MHTKPCPLSSSRSRLLHRQCRSKINSPTLRSTTLTSKILIDANHNPIDNRPQFDRTQPPTKSRSIVDRIATDVDHNPTRQRWRMKIQSFPTAIRPKIDQTQSPTKPRQVSDQIAIENGQNHSATSSRNFNQFQPNSNQNPIKIPPTPTP